MKLATPTDKLQEEIESIVKEPELLGQKKESVEAVMKALDEGKIRVCEKRGGEWVTHAWIKQAILFYFRISELKSSSAGDLKFYDKIPLKEWTAEQKVRVVPHAVARYGSYVEPGAVLMPCYVNTGAYVGAGSMIDTWATVGSCAQIGKQVHLSGGVGVGGVLEPVQALPVIIEDHVFVGSRCIIVEGAWIEEGAVLGAGTVITASTRIVDVTGEKEVIHKGRVPKNAVVIPGSSVKKFPAGDYMIPSALLIGYRNESTDKKTSLNSALRDFDLSA